MGISQLSMGVMRLAPILADGNQKSKGNDYNGLEAPTQAGNWSISNFLSNSIDTMQTWGGYVVLLIGVILIIYAVVKIAMGLASYGKKQTSWAVAIIMLVLGGAMLFGGWNMISGIAAGGGNTITELGNGSVSTMLFTIQQFLH